MASLRSEVIKCFKTLHRTSRRVFNGDHNTLAEARKQINEGFKKNKNEKDAGKIRELINQSSEIEHELKTTVIQAVEVKPNVYEANIRPEILKLDNIPFNEKAVMDCPSTPTKKCS